MQSNRTCPLVEQYLGYLSVIKGRSENTILEYRTDILTFFNYLAKQRQMSIDNRNFSFADVYKCQ